MSHQVAQLEGRVIGVESSDGPAMKRSIEAGRLETIDCGTIARA